MYNILFAHRKEYPNECDDTALIISEQQGVTCGIKPDVDTDVAGMSMKVCACAMRL